MLKTTQRTYTRSKRILRALIAGIVVSGISFQASETPTFNRIYSATFSADAALSQPDASAYQMLFSAQSRGDWEAADNALMNIQDQRLLGTLLAARYLDNRYKATSDELVAWLENYSDQPEAARIRSLAQHKGAEESALAEAASPESIQGVGRVDTMGSSDMPDSWYRGLSHWKSGKTQDALNAFIQASASKNLTAWQRSAIYFWQYRAHSKLGHQEEAERTLAQAAESPRTFYGMLAQQTLDEPIALTAFAPYVADSVRAHPSVKRASALSQIGEYTLAEKELRHLYKRMDAENRPALITIASELNLPNLQVRLGQVEGIRNEEAVFASYPMPRWLSEEELKVDSALMFAISRQESSFATEVKSHAGATGLMQLMPATANYIWKKSSDALLASIDETALPDSTSRIAQSDLHDPKTNMLLGQQYVLYLMGKSGSDANLVHVIASYNAGPGMVSVWNRSASNMSDPLLYIESIPYKETRHYVMQVFSNYWAYQSLMGKDAVSLKQLAQGAWPTVPNPTQ